MTPTANGRFWARAIQFATFEQIHPVLARTRHDFFLV